MAGVWGTSPNNASAAVKLAFAALLLAVVDDGLSQDLSVPLVVRGTLPPRRTQVLVPSVVPTGLVFLGDVNQLFVKSEDLGERQ